MNGLLRTVLFVLLVTLSQATEVRKCPKSKATKLPADDVSLTSCANGKCVLKRNSKVEISMKFTPDRDFEDITSDISGIILNVPLPFPGYFGTSACPYIYDAEGKEKVGCPLKKGNTYTYKNSFKVLPVYPTVSLIVHWGLGDGQGDAVCFEIPAKIK